MIKNKRIELSSSEIKKNSPYLIVCNHQYALDGVIVGYLLPWNIQWKQAPYNFMMANKFFKIWIFNPLLVLWGIFPAKPHRLFKFGVDRATHLLRKKHTVMMFPEGKVGRYDRQYQPRRGVEIMANIEDVCLIPVRVKFIRKKGLWKSYSLAVGKPFDGKNMTAEQIMDVVYGLKFR